jgi:Icc-related predicted phosphoesterase
MPATMKLLHVSDLHFRTHWFEWVAAQSRNYDAVCLSGDLLDMFGTAKTPLRLQANWVRSWLREFPGRLFVCSGNHDWWDSAGVVDTDAHCGWLDKMGRPEVTIDGQGADCGGCYIFCHPFRSPAVWPQAPHGKWILLHHLPPALAATAVGGSGGNDNGCRELAGALTTAARPPWIVLSGHLHKPKSWRGQCGKSWSFNPTYDETATFPNHIILDLKEGMATWVTERAGRWALRVL